MTLRVRRKCTAAELMNVHKLLPCLGRAEILPTTVEQSVELFRQITLAESESRWRCRCTLTVSKEEYLSAALWPGTNDTTHITPASASRSGPAEPAESSREEDVERLVGRSLAH